MIVLAQRWIQRNERQVVEALVIAASSDQPTAAGGYGLYSAYYAPTEGQTLANAEWHARGMQGMMPALALLAMDILSKWAIPPEEARSLAQYTQHLDRLVQEVKDALAAAQRRIK